VNFTHLIILGLVPAYISSFIVPQIGTFLSKELMMTGRRVNALEAKQLGFINCVVENEKEMNEKIQFYVNEFMEGGPNAISKIKELVTFIGSDKSKEEENLKFVEETFQWMFKSPESKYGMMSFMQKKKPNWNEFYKSKL
jgi:methylglutaconyl-CoA hydratase